MRKLVGLVVVLVLGVAPAALAKRGDDGGKKQGCSKETYRLVLEREDTFKLCVFPK